MCTLLCVLFEFLLKSGLDDCSVVRQQKMPVIRRLSVLRFSLKMERPARGIRDVFVKKTVLPVDGFVISLLTKKRTAMEDGELRKCADYGEHKKQRDRGQVDLPTPKPDPSQGSAAGLVIIGHRVVLFQRLLLFLKYFFF